MHNAGHVNGRNILVHAATMLAAHDLAGVTATCRALQQMITTVVHALVGFDRSRLPETALESAMRQFPFLKAVTVSGCLSLRVIVAWPSTLTKVGSEISRVKSTN